VKHWLVRPTLPRWTFHDKHRHPSTFDLQRDCSTLFLPRATVAWGPTESSGPRSPILGSFLAIVAVVLLRRPLLKLLYSLRASSPVRPGHKVPLFYLQGAPSARLLGSDPTDAQACNCAKPSSLLSLVRVPPTPTREFNLVLLHRNLIFSHPPRSAPYNLPMRRFLLLNTCFDFALSPHLRNFNGIYAARPLSCSKGGRYGNVVDPFCRAASSPLIYC